MYAKAITANDMKLNTHLTPDMMDLFMVKNVSAHSNGCEPSPLQAGLTQNRSGISIPISMVMAIASLVQNGQLSSQMFYTFLQSQSLFGFAYNSKRLNNYLQQIRYKHVSSEAFLSSLSCV